MAPWNYPFALTFIPLATALAAGNRAMLKPSELTPRTSEVMRRMLAETFPSEEVAVVLGGPEVGAAFSGLPFDHLLFTGSTQVGRKVMKAASDNLVPVTLGLGGKSSAIVARGHVDGRTMSSIVFGKLSNGGQTCVAPDYALVHEDDLDAFVAQYDAAVARFYPGGPTSPDYTSIVSDRHFDRLKGLIDEARSKGARVIEVGVNPQQAATRKRTLAPTLIVGAGDDTTVMQEEIFGPILPVRTYRTIDEVVDYVNARPRPLALYYFGAQDSDCESLLKRTTSGNVGINNTLLHVAQEDLPFGGVGERDGRVSRHRGIPRDEPCEGRVRAGTLEPAEPAACAVRQARGSVAGGAARAQPGTGGRAGGIEREALRPTMHRDRRAAASHAARRCGRTCMRR